MDYGGQADVIRKSQYRRTDVFQLSNGWDQHGVSYRQLIRLKNPLFSENSVIA